MRAARDARGGVAECTGCDGVNHVTNTGSNYWVPGPKSNQPQSYLITGRIRRWPPTRSTSCSASRPRVELVCLGEFRTCSHSGCEEFCIHSRKISV